MLAHTMQYTSEDAKQAGAAVRASSPLLPTVKELLLFHTGTPLFVVQ